MPNYLITSSFEPVKKGDEFDGQLPPHVTIQQYFTLPSEPAFLNSLQNYAATLTPFTVIGGERDLFGENEDVPVTRLSGIGKLAVIHGVTSGIIKQHGGEFLRPEWHDRGYQPHVADTVVWQFEKGKTAEVRTVELIRVENDGDRRLKRMLAVLALRERDAPTARY